jgi:hypothetical protein
MLNVDYRERITTMVATCEVLPYNFLANVVDTNICTMLCAINVTSI